MCSDGLGFGVCVWPSTSLGGGKEMEKVVGWLFTYLRDLVLSK